MLFWHAMLVQAPVHRPSPVTSEAWQSVSFSVPGQPTLVNGSQPGTQAPTVPSPMLTQVFSKQPTPPSGGAPASPHMRSQVPALAGSHSLMSFGRQPSGAMLLTTKQ